MSHWSTGNTVIRDLDLLKRIAKEKGCEVVEEKVLRSGYAGSVDAEFLLRHRGGVAGVVKSDNAPGEYLLQLDNWNNPIVESIGYNGGDLTREYVVEKAKQEAAMMGGMISSQQVNRDGSVDLEIQIAI